MAETRSPIPETMAVRERHRFDEAALEAWLAANVADFAGPMTVRQCAGGQSNPTYLVETPGRRYALRRKPPGKLLKSAHAVDREYRVITALGQSDVPIAKTHALCTDESVIGTWFYVMDYVDGRIFWDMSLPDLAKAERTAIYDEMNRVLAALHSVDYESVGLADFGKPGNYFARQISRWSGQYRASETEDIPAMNNLIEWLPGNIPPSGEDETTIVHGDYRLDNAIFHPSEPKILAVIDWELSTLGHPLGDLTYQCLHWRLPQGMFNGLGGRDLAGLGIPSEQDYIDAYCARTGRDGVENLDFYIAYALFRLAAILQGIAMRIKQGTASSREAEAHGRLARPLAELGWQTVEGMGT